MAASVRSRANPDQLAGRFPLPMTWMDRYDWVAIPVFVVLFVVGWIATGQWLAFLAIGAAAGNLSAYLLRRRAGVPDRSPYGRLRDRRDRRG